MGVGHLKFSLDLTVNLPPDVSVAKVVCPGINIIRKVDFWNTFGL